MIVDVFLKNASQKIIVITHFYTQYLIKINENPQAPDQTKVSISMEKPFKTIERVTNGFTGVEKQLRSKTFHISLFLR